MYKTYKSFKDLEELRLNPVLKKAQKDLLRDLLQLGKEINLSLATKAYLSDQDVLYLIWKSSKCFSFLELDTSGECDFHFTQENVISLWIETSNVRPLRKYLHTLQHCSRWQS